MSSKIHNLRHYSRARKRKPGQRLKKKQRCELQQQFIDTFGHLGNVQAMTQLGLSRFTLYAWLRDPDFKARYEAKLATYQLAPYEWMTDEQATLFCQSLPDWRLIQHMKIMERMNARRGQPYDIWW